MTHPENSEFGDFEDEFQKSKKAAPGAGIDRLPEGLYKGVCTSVDMEGDGKLVDHDIFTTGSGTRGFKLFFEILEPEKVKDVKTKGEIHEHVFWITNRTFEYLKRDIASILGRDLNSLSELKTIQWAGKTLEFGVKDETYQGFTRSRTTFINAWSPTKGGSKDGQKDGEPASAGAAGSKEGDVDF